MRSRKYTKVVEFWQVESVSDGYGGNTTPTETLVAKSWANVKTVSNNKQTIQNLTDIGINDPVNAIIINLRYRNDIVYNAINQYIKYQGVKYIVQNNPTNINLNSVEIQIIATREQTDSVTVI